MEPFLYDKFFEIEDKHWWFKARSDIILEIISSKLAIPDGSKILDIGCGTGGPLMRLAARFDAWGIDTSDRAVEYCERRGLKNVFRCDLGEFVQKHTDFRLATLLDVVEHVDDDVSFLSLAAKSLTKGGMVLITVPAYPFLWSQHDVVNHHKRRYTRRTLEALISNSGLELEFISYYNTILFPAVVAQRYLENVLGRNSDRELNMPGGLVNGILYRVFSSEKNLLKSIPFPFGVSLIAIARKRDSST